MKMNPCYMIDIDLDHFEDEMKEQRSSDNRLSHLNFVGYQSIIMLICVFYDFYPG